MTNILELVAWKFKIKIINMLNNLMQRYYMQKYMCDIQMLTLRNNQEKILEIIMKEECL